MPKPEGLGGDNARGEYICLSEPQELFLYFICSLEYVWRPETIVSNQKGKKDIPERWVEWKTYSKTNRVENLLC